MFLHFSINKKANIHMKKIFAAIELKIYYLMLTLCLPFIRHTSKALDSLTFDFHFNEILLKIFKNYFRIWCKSFSLHGNSLFTYINFFKIIIGIIIILL